MPRTDTGCETRLSFGRLYAVRDDQLARLDLHEDDLARLKPGLFQPLARQSQAGGGAGSSDSGGRPALPESALSVQEADSELPCVHIVLLSGNQKSPRRDCRGLMDTNGAEPESIPVSHNATNSSYFGEKAA